MVIPSVRRGRHSKELLGIHGKCSHEGPVGFASLTPLHRGLSWHREFEEVNLRFYVRREATDGARRAVMIGLCCRAHTARVSSPPRRYWNRDTGYRTNDDTGNGMPDFGHETTAKSGIVPSIRYPDSGISLPVSSFVRHPES